MKFLKWIFCTLAISAGAFFAIGSPNPVISDNYEALTSGDCNVRMEEIKCDIFESKSEKLGVIKYDSGYCGDSDNTVSSKNATCIDIIVTP
ncbi:MAG TPA: hypothetical protein VFC94_01975 [Bacteroidaceae bacterium]|nr:hypothetical protein [Bacteroidaceae bacterium]